MSFVLSEQVYDLKLSRGVANVLRVLCRYANEDGTSCYPSVDTIARDGDCCVRTVQYKLRVLERMQVVVVLNRGTGRTSTRYQIDLSKAPRKPEITRVTTKNDPATAAPVVLDEGCQSCTPGVQILHPTLSVTLSPEASPRLQGETCASAPCSAPDTAPPRGGGGQVGKITKKKTKTFRKIAEALAVRGLPSGPRVVIEYARGLKRAGLTKLAAFEDFLDLHDREAHEAAWQEGLSGPFWRHFGHGRASDYLAGKIVAQNAQERECAHA